MSPAFTRAAILVALVAASACAQELGPDASGRTIQITTGETFVVALGANRTTGFDWTVATQWDEALLALDGTTYGSDAPPGIVGAGGTSRWTFRAKAPGTTSFKLVYRRPWPGGEVSDRTFDLTVTVVAQ